MAKSCKAPPDYIVIALVDYVKFMQSVKEHMKDGWKLQGGVSVVVIEPIIYKMMYHQAMTKNYD